ncbi:hypothetical protein N665_0006s0043 [Sinapis alba]|nr:hypothetical protein N665_0006s0043 [Sinapis alba]
MRGEADNTWPEMEEAVARKMAEEVETESSGSSEAETESPRSVGRWGGAPVTGKTTKERVLHSQVLKIKEEEDLCVLFEDRDANRRYVHPHRLGLVLISRANLPCSPLGGKVGPLKLFSDE